MDTPAIVDKHDMHFLARTRLFKMTGIRGDGLPRRTTRQQSQKDTQMLSQWNDLLDTHTGDVRVRKVGAHVGITFIGANDEFTRLGHGKINTG